VVLPVQCAHAWSIFSCICPSWFTIPVQIDTSIFAATFSVHIWSTCMACNPWNDSECIHACQKGIARNFVTYVCHCMLIHYLLFGIYKTWNFHPYILRYRELYHFHSATFGPPFLVYSRGIGRATSSMVVALGTCTYTRSPACIRIYTCAMIRSCCAAGCTLGWLVFAFGYRSVVAPPGFFA